MLTMFHHVTVWSALALLAALRLGNYLWQWAVHRSEPDWDIAAERSYFEAFAIFFCWIMWR
jgi:hypothetical protein